MRTPRDAPRGQHMSTEGNDPRGRGRGFFRSRRRQAPSEEQPPTRETEGPAPDLAPPPTPEAPPASPSANIPEPPVGPSPPVPAAAEPAAEPPALPEVPAESAGEIPMTGATVTVDATPTGESATPAPVAPSEQWT